MMIKGSIKKIILLAGCMISSFIPVNADNDPVNTGLTADMLRPDFSKLTPEVASLGRFGAFQVSEYSGSANISIPLYNIQSGCVSFPISLYYDASGIKVEQDATFVGLGWNLSYGGVISHITCGENDFKEDLGYPDFNQNWWKAKFKELKSKIPSEPPFYIENYVSLRKSKNPAFTYGSPTELTDDLLLTEEVAKEMEFYKKMSKGYDVPDVYQASFCGHNISFAIDKRTGKNSDGVYPIVVLNNNPEKYRISYSTGGDPRSPIGYPSSFVITDDKGINYSFKGYCENLIYRLGGGCFDSYYLTKVYGPDGENGKSVVKLEYEQIYFSYGGTSRIAIKEHKPNAKRIFRDKDNIPSGAFNSFIALTQPSSYSAEIASGESGRCDKVYPTKIITATDTIYFTKGAREDIPDAKCISGMIIKPRIGHAEKKISFTYGTFTETPAKSWHTYSHKRLKLTGVIIDDQKYGFEYDDRNLPSFASYSKDYWGYYNGANPNDNQFVGCTPAYSISTDGVVRPVDHLDGSNRFASEELCSVGMLKKVTYPTGGYTTYEFESNRFNDPYYYPDANKCKVSFPPSSYTVNDASISMYGNMSKTDILRFSQDTKVDVKITASLMGSDELYITIRNMSTNTLVESFYYKADRQVSKTSSLTLSKNIDYKIEAKLTAASSNQTSTVAQCQFTHEVINTNVTAKPLTANEKGGYSIGGGLRIKTIKNYDSDKKYINGVRYDYYGGKLLRPTIQLETHYVDCNYDDDPSFGIHFSFQYANTEPSYLYICSLGIPATIGYDRVVKNEINEQGNVTYRKTILNFHNYGYNSSCYVNQINSLMQNFIYYPPYSNGHLNGKIKNDSICNGSALLSTTQYEYESKVLDTIYYQKCLPRHLPINGAAIDYNQGFFRKCNTWTYLTSKTSTLYDSNGKNPRTTTTSLIYNSLNYRTSEQTITDGVSTSRTHYYYPLDSDNKSTGLSNLTGKHNIIEVTAVDSYRNGIFVGGSRYNYTQNGNLPVVNNGYSILPNSSKTAVLEMSVMAWDSYGNIREYKQKNGTPVTVLWSYGHKYPVMEIVGLTYSEVKSAASSAVTSLEAQPISASGTISSSVVSLHNTLKSKNAYVTGVIYDSWFNVSSVISPNGSKKYYNYDGFGRLTSIVDPLTGILKKYSYNYKNK